MVAIYLAHDTAGSSKAFKELPVTAERSTFFLPNTVSKDPITLSSEINEGYSHLCVGTFPYNLPLKSELIAHQKFTTISLFYVPSITPVALVRSLEITTSQFSFPSRPLIITNLLFCGTMISSSVILVGGQLFGTMNKGRSRTR
jgi:hypothetical protein